jgi:hypothetical protein
LITTLYKIYVAVLAEKIRKKMEERGMMPQNQTGFRKRMGTMNNIYVINYLGSN